MINKNIFNLNFSKKDKKLLIGITIFSLCILSLVYINYTKSKNVICQPNNKLVIHYINVGQGDSILIQINNKNLLIDSGDKNSKINSYLKSKKIHTLDHVIATHPHEDHIGNMSSVIKKFNIKNFYAPKANSNSQSLKKMFLSLNKKNIKITPIQAGKTINLDENLKCFVLAPNNEKYDNLNNYSVVLKIIYKNTSFLFTGDAESLSEEEIIKSGFNIKSDVLKLAHHGSNSSTCDSFLNEVNPKVAIISCGKNNEYGHPNKNTLIKLKGKKITTYRTDLNGTIILESDGYQIIKK